VAQRKTLAKSKDSLAKDFEKFIRDYDAQKVDFQQNIERLSAANARVTQ
jgi:chromosome segregation ATPase